MGGQKYQDSSEELRGILEPPTPGIPVERLTEAIAQSVSSKGRQRTKGDRIEKTGMCRAVRAGSGHQVCKWKELFTGFTQRREREGSGFLPREMGW